MTSLQTVKKTAIELALIEMEKAVLLPTHHHKVGASIYTKDSTCYGGFNIQNPSHKGYHAEEMAILCCYLSSVKPESVIGIIITTTFTDSEEGKYCFGCGHCLQMMWEYTRNPELLITIVNVNGEIVGEKKLGEVYPYPYPR
jgi:cytidine deaminase